MQYTDANAFRSLGLAEPSSARECDAALDRIMAILDECPEHAAARAAASAVGRQMQRLASLSLRRAFAH